VKRAPDTFPAALAAALAALSPALTSFFARRAGRGAAADLAQETAFRIARLAPAYDAARPPEPWIWRVARLVLLEHLRAPRAASLEEEEEAAPAARDGAGPPFAAARREHEEAVWTAVRALPDAPRSRLRAAVALHALEGVPHARLAAALGISEPASKMRAARGLEALAAHLAPGADLRGPTGGPRAAAVSAAWAFVRAQADARAERAAILGVFGSIPAPLRRALEVADAPIDEEAIASAADALVAAGFPP
jgi:RNA polymerase sigma-70 factor (ECF subfamily)